MKTFTEKRLVLFIILIFTVLFMILTGMKADNVFADDGSVNGTEADETTWIKSGYIGDSEGIPWHVSSDGELIIGEDGKECSYIQENSNGFSFPWGSASVEINQETVTLRNYICKVRFAGTVHLGVNCGGMFSNFEKLEEVDFSGLDASGIISMAGMFYNCSSLKEIDLSGLDVQNVTAIASMFFGCSQLISADLSCFSSAKLTRMESLFEGCTNLQEVNLSGINTSNVNLMDRMFYKCESIQSIDLSSFDTRSLQVKDMYRKSGSENMFFKCFPEEIALGSSTFPSDVALNVWITRIRTLDGEPVNGPQFDGLQSYDGTAPGWYAVGKVLDAPRDPESGSGDSGSGSGSGSDNSGSGTGNDQSSGNESDSAGSSDNTGGQSGTTSGESDQSGSSSSQSGQSGSSTIQENDSSEQAGNSSTQGGSTDSGNKNDPDSSSDSGKSTGNDSSNNQNSSDDSIAAPAENSKSETADKSDTDSQADSKSDAVTNNNSGTTINENSGKSDGSAVGDTTIGSQKKKITSVKIQKSKYAYTGKKIKPGITVKSGTATLKKGRDYTVSYTKNSKIGKAKVLITGKGMYSGTVSRTFWIVPNRAIIKARTFKVVEGTQIIIKVKSKYKPKYYELVLAKDKKCRKVVAHKIFSSKSVTNRKIYAYKRLKKNKSYYVKVRVIAKGGVKGKYSKKIKIKGRG